MKNTFCLLVWALAISKTWAADFTTLKYPLNTPIAKTESPYTPLILQMVNQWPKEIVPHSGPEGREVDIKVFETPGSDSYIGIEQHMAVHANVQQVEKIVEDINHYKELFPGFADIHTENVDENKIDVYWENIIPVFFIPNLKYRTTYLVDKSRPKRTIYRAQLKEKRGLNLSDLLIVLEPLSNGVTQYTEYDFWDADYGTLKQIAGDKIWKDSVEAVIVSDLSFKFKAENPSVPNAQILEKSKKAVEKYPIDNLLKSKEVFALWKKTEKKTESSTNVQLQN